MKVRLWIYSKSRNTKEKLDLRNYGGEELLDTTIEPFGSLPLNYFHLAPQTSIYVGNKNNPPTLMIVENNMAVKQLPEGSTMEIRRNGRLIDVPLKGQKFEELTIKDHICVMVSTGPILEITDVIVVSITQK